MASMVINMAEIGEGIKAKLVYKDRIENIKRALAIFREDSLTQANISLWTGFGRNNRKLLGLRPREETPSPPTEEE